ncbi:MAG TPA: hypothetical protein VG755_39760 [Nannocystaceae bacterium]|nr:hypothetical protein [Nannocystaceae bacterium]
MLPIAALALVLLLGGVESRAPAVDAQATADALKIRVGERASSWTIAIDPGATESEVHAHMRHDAGRALDRSFTLTGETQEERSRELAAALALVIEQHATDTSPPPERDPDPPPTPARPAPPEGWLAIGGRASVGSPAHPEGGVTLRGGATWGRRILQPIASFGTAHARRDSLQVDGVRIGAGLAVGSPIPRSPVWLGGAVVPQAAWTLARGRGRASTWSSVTELSALAQLRTHGVLVGLRLGVELAGPPLAASNGPDRIRLGTARFVAGLEIGVLLHTKKRSSR